MCFNRIRLKRYRDGEPVYILIINKVFSHYRRFYVYNIDLYMCMYVYVRV